MSEYDDEFDPADAIDVSDLDRLDDPEDLDDPLLDEDDLAFLRAPSRPTKASGGRKSSKQSKRKKP